jgi:hypothetical protein
MEFPAGRGGQLAGVGDAGVRQRLGELGEEFLGPAVGQPGPARDRVDVGGGQRGARPPAGAEDLASAPSADPMTSAMRPGFVSIRTRLNGLMRAGSTSSS